MDPASLLSSIGPVGTGLALAAVPVAAYLTKVLLQPKIDRLEGELNYLKTKTADDLARAEQKYEDLDQRYQNIRKSGALIQLQLEAIITEVAEAANRLDATDYSVLVPAPTSIPGDTPDELVFLCISGPQASKLKWVRVPISSSLCGQSYLSGKAMIASPPSGAFANRTDKIAGFTTSQTLSVCLRYRNERVGVAQFLNKRSGLFDADDADRALVQCAALARTTAPLPTCSINIFRSCARSPFAMEPQSTSLSATVFY